MNKKSIIILIFTLILLNISLISAAKIHGNIYNIDLNPAKDTILKINTIPEQTYVSKDGSYTFTIKPGNYIITALYQKYTTEKEIKIIEEGSYVLDIILFTNLEPKDTEPEDPYKEPVSIWWYIGIIFIIAVISLVLYKKRKPKKKPKEHEDDLSKKVIKFIKDEGGRTTQKEIRKKFPMSEAKISLVITELENKGLLKKIKKGRGNVIILN